MKVLCQPARIMEWGAKPRYTDERRTAVIRLEARPKAAATRVAKAKGHGCGPPGD